MMEHLRTLTQTDISLVTYTHTHTQCVQLDDQLLLLHPDQADDLPAHVPPRDVHVEPGLQKDCRSQKWPAKKGVRQNTNIKISAFRQT